MAYIVDGKIYTDHSLLDEIVYNTKLILDRIVLKNLKVADQYETAYSMEQADYLLAIDNGSMDLSIFPLTAEILTSYGYNPIQVRAYLLDRSTIPEEDREDLLSFCNQWFLDHYEETNFYYRMLNGLPEYGTDEYNVYIDPNNPKLIPDNGRTDFNFSAPLHEYTIAQLNTLETLGIMDDIYAEYTDKHHRYLKYIGAYKIDIITARSAGIWDILFMPIVEPMVSDRFTELYNINRDIYYRRTFQDAYKLESDYYDEMCMLMIICQTYTDMIVDTPEWYIRRDIFDLRTCEYFLTSQGVEFFKEIPLKYQIRIVKNLNKLIKYKSTTKNIYDILEIFSVEGTTVYKYYLYKKYLYTAYEEVNPEPEPDPENPSIGIPVDPQPEEKLNSITFSKVILNSDGEKATDEDFKEMWLDSDWSYNFKITLTNIETNEYYNIILNSDEPKTISGLKAGTYKIEEADDNYFDFSSFELDTNGLHDSSLTKKDDGYYITICDCNEMEHSENIIVNNELEEHRGYEDKDEENNGFWIPKQRIANIPILQDQNEVYDTWIPKEDIDNIP